MSVSSGPFPWESAGFGQTTPATVPTAEAPAEGTTAANPAPASKLSEDAPKDTAAEGTPASEPVKPDAAKVDASIEAAAAADEPGRRQSARERDAAEKADLQAAVAAALAERDAAQAVAAQAAAEKAAREAAAQAAAERYAKLIGPEDEYRRRARISNRMFDENYDGPKLTVEEAAELARWETVRELREPFVQEADQTAAAWVDEQINGQRQTWARQALAVADEIGLPRAALREPDLGVLLKATATNTAARIREAEVKPLQEQISQLEGTIKGLETKAVHAARTPVIGGRSDGSLPPADGAGWDPSLPWSGNFGRTPAAAAS